MTTLKYGYRYEIVYPNSDVYRFAEPVEYADGCVIGDCWIVDEDGNVDPDYDVSPVPFCASSLGNPREKGSLE